MIEHIHKHITSELQQNTRTDIIFILAAILLNLITLAVNSGMSNYTTNGLGVTPEFGTSPKLCAVIIDAEIPIDHPRDLNADEFCSRCRLCQKSCPVGAIPKETIKWMGANKRKLHEKKCWSWMVDNLGCGICMKVCPYNEFGYERCMDSIPQYYRYNTMEKHIGKEAKSRWR